LHRQSVKNKDCGHARRPLGETLRELALLAGQKDTLIPVLELQIAEVVVRATVESVDALDYLFVEAWLPVSERSRFLGPRPERLPPEELPPGAATICWDEERSRYLATRRVPASALHSERELMDAILVTADEAIGWLALITKLPLNQPPPTPAT
jgi:hypothetical protein